MVGKESQKIIPNIILCGGSGTRLWPISRKLYPKQFLRIHDNLSLLQHTIIRNSAVCEHFIVTCHKDTVAIAIKQINEINYLDKCTIIVEPVAKNTTTPIAVASFFVKAHEEFSNTVLVTPSDHFIIDKNNVPSYNNTIANGVEIATNDKKIVTYGIAPTYPETNYGYIHAYKKYEKNTLLVEQFKEKPDITTATSYLNNGDYFWNSGIFTFDVDLLLSELHDSKLELYCFVEKAYNELKPSKINEYDVLTLQEEYLTHVESISIDYSVIENSKNIVCLPSLFTWSDLGSFESIYDTLQKDNDDSVVLNHERLLSVNSKQNLVYNMNTNHNRLIATIGVDNLIIADTEDCVLIAKRGSSQNVKFLIDTMLESGDSSQADTHTNSIQTWGELSTIFERDKLDVLPKIHKNSLRNIQKITLLANETVHNKFNHVDIYKYKHNNLHIITLYGEGQITFRDKSLIETGKYTLAMNEHFYIDVEHNLEDYEVTNSSNSMTLELLFIFTNME